MSDIFLPIQAEDHEISVSVKIDSVILDIVQDADGHVCRVSLSSSSYAELRHQMDVASQKISESRMNIRNQALKILTAPGGNPVVMMYLLDNGLVKPEEVVARYSRISDGEAFNGIA